MVQSEQKEQLLVRVDHDGTVQNKLLVSVFTFFLDPTRRVIAAECALNCLTMGERSTLRGQLRSSPSKSGQFSPLVGSTCSGLAYRQEHLGPPMWSN